MSENSTSTQDNRYDLFDYLAIVLKWKKFIIINVSVIFILSIIFSLLIPKTYKATARITLSNQQSGGLSGFGSLLSSDNPLLSIGSQYLGGVNTSQDLILGLLNSRTILSAAIKKFDLMKYYGIDDNNMDKALKAFQGDVDFEVNENGLIEISNINKDPKEAAAIANYLVQLADSMNIKLNIEQAKNNTDFIGKRYQKNVKDLKTAEDSMYHFQKRYGIYAIPEQLVTAFQAAGDLESDLLKQQIAAEYARNQYGANSPQYKMLTDQVNFIEGKIKELKYSKTLSYPTNVLVPFEKLPKMIEEYFRFYREINIQTKIMEFILPMYEQAKVQEQKSIPTLVVVDKAVAPELKAGPKRSIIVLAATFIALFLSVIIALFSTAYQNNKHRLNLNKTPPQL